MPPGIRPGGVDISVNSPRSFAQRNLRQNARACRAAASCLFLPAPSWGEDFAFPRPHGLGSIRPDPTAGPGFLPLPLTGLGFLAVTPHGMRHPCLRRRRTCVNSRSGPNDRRRN